MARVFMTALLALLLLGGCTDNRNISESPPVPGDPTRMYVERLVVDVDEQLRAHAEAWITGHAITDLLDNEARRPWNARVAGGIKYADLFQELYPSRNNHKLFARSDGLTPRGEATLKVLAAADRHALDPAPYHIARIQTLASELERLTREGPTWDKIQLRPEEAEALTRWLRREKLDPHDPETRLRVLDVLIGRDEPLPVDGADPDRPKIASNAPAPRIAAHVARFREIFERSARLTAELELRIADGSLRYARDMKHFNLNRLDWRDLKEAGGSKNLIYGRLEKTFDALASAPVSEVDDIFEELAPSHPQYASLVDALARYRALAADGGWERVRPTSLEIGARSSRVAKLRERLAAEGYLERTTSAAAVSDEDDSSSGEAHDAPSQVGAPAPTSGNRAAEREDSGASAIPAFEPDVVDESLVQATKSYQETHQFRPTGEPTGGFWRSLNVPIEQRIRQIELTLQRWRESRYEGEKDYVFVNIPDFHAEVWRSGERQMRFRVVVGNNARKCDRKTRKWVYPNATPVQMAEMDHLILNPSWWVPRRIIDEEIMPEVRKNADWLEEKNYEWVDMADGKQRIRQKPGPDNALGLVKFIFPNPHNTYMHDTPKKKYFDYPVRAFSHGCVRVQDPLDFAEHLIIEEKKGDRESMEAYLDSEKTIKIEFDQKIPVFFEYYVVRVDAQGRTHFLADIYRLDKKRLSDDPEKIESCRVHRRTPVKPESDAEDGEESAPEEAADDLGP